MRPRFLLVVLLFLSATLLASCEAGLSGGAGFAGGGNRADRNGDQSDNNGDDAADGEDGDDGNSDAGDIGNTGIDSDSDVDTDANGGDDDEDDDDGDDDDGDDEDDLGLEEEDLCSSKGFFHIVMIFDNSGSQGDDDLESMRAGATALVNSAASFVGKENAPTIKLSTIRFSDDATIGSNRWVNVSDGTASILSDVQQATADDGGDTHYGAAFNTAATLFGEIETSSTKKTHRNYVLFFTDGKPDDDVSDILNSVNPLVEDKGVAVLAVGTGGDADDIEETLSQLALPKTGIVAADHVGSAQSADTQQAVVNTFTNLFDKVTSACD